MFQTSPWDIHARQDVLLVIALILEFASPVIEALFSRFFTMDSVLRLALLVLKRETAFA